jgi:hypothetical protein
MTLLPRLEHRFIDVIPDNLEPGVLYVSMEYATATHSCCCGCGEEVVTPFSPTDWRMEFDGESISLSPSVGSWTLPCRSHYVIKRGKVIEAGPWSEEQIEAGRRRDRKAKAQHYGTVQAEPPASTPVSPKAVRKPGMLDRLKLWLGLD